MFTTVAIRTCASAPADAFADDAVERGGMARLADHPVNACRIRRAKDGPDVVRVFDPVEHDEERRRRTGARDQILDRIVARRRDLRHDVLMRSAARDPRQRFRIDPLHRHVQLSRQRNRLIDPPVGASSHTEALHAAPAKGFEHGVETVDVNQESSQLPAAFLTAVGPSAAAAYNRARLPSP